MTIKSLLQKQAIVEYLTENVEGKITDFTVLLGVQSSRVKKLVYELLEDDIIVAEGANRNRMYKLKALSQQTIDF